MSIFGKIFSPMGRLLQMLNAHILAMESEGVDITDYVAALESHFQVVLAVEDVAQLFTLDDMVRLIERKLHEAKRPLGDGEIWPAVRDITSEQMGVDRSEIKRTTRYIEDLCC